MVEKEDIRNIIIDSMVVSLEAQVRALKKLRGGDDRVPQEKSRSQVDMVSDILDKAGKPLHVSEIIAAIEKKFEVRLERESLVSSLSKKVMKGERFVRAGKNTFALKGR